MNIQEEEKKIQIRPYTLKELAMLYGVSTITFRKWINKFKTELGERSGRHYSIPQVKIIFKHLDIPSVIKVAA